MNLPRFEYLAPRDRSELASLLAEHGSKAKLLAGGTDLINALKERACEPEYVIDISGLKDLAEIDHQPGQGVTIGALTTFEEIEKSRVLAERYPALVAAASVVGSPQIRAMGTLGGNSCNASPAADTPPALIAYGAEVRLVSAEGSREIPLAGFITHNRKTALEPGEYLESFFLPEPDPQSACGYAYAGLREAMEIDLVNAAVYLAREGRAVAKARIVLGAMAPTPIRASQAEGMLTGREPTPELIEEAAGRAAAEARPIDDFRASAEYRCYAAGLLVRQTLEKVAAQSG